jgi:hypothetical protein
MIHQYLDYPSQEEWVKIEENSEINSLYLDIEHITVGSGLLSIYYSSEMNSWLQLFNNRLGQARISYVFLSHYYNKGIPDDEWYRSPGDTGQSIQYFPHFSEEHYNFKLMFDFYAETFYNKLYSAWDTIYHLVNIYYRFDVKPNFRFSVNVMKELLAIDEVAHAILDSAKKSKEFITFKELRNNIIHNFAPNDISSGMMKTNISEGMLLPDGKLAAKNGIQISMSVGKYTPSRVFKENIDQTITSYIEVLHALKVIFESDSKRK